jgi:uncharacterized lipoprotein YmbA
MTHARRAAACAAAALALLAGCATAPSKFYALSSTAAGDGATPVPCAVLVGPVSVPAPVDRPEFVVEVSPNRVELDEFNRWASPLNDAIARAVAGDLAVLLASPDVAVAPLANFHPDYRVTINVQRFDSIAGQSVLIDAVWAVHPSGGGTTRSGRTTAREVVSEESFDALAAAHSRALAQVSGDIAAAIRTARAD